MNTHSTDTQPAIEVCTEFNVEHFKVLYQPFDQTTLSELTKLYAPDIIFKDPIHQIQGIAELRDYFAGFLNPAMQCQFEFTHQLLSQDQAFFQWKMYYQHTQLAGGKLLQLNGGTLIRFNKQIFYHEDYYDMGAMIYQHIPLLGWAVKKINARLTANTSEPTS